MAARRKVPPLPGRTAEPQVYYDVFVDLVEGQDFVYQTVVGEKNAARVADQLLNGTLAISRVIGDSIRFYPTTSVKSLTVRPSVKASEPLPE